MSPTYSAGLVTQLVPGSDRQKGQLSRELFENAGIAVGEATPSPVTSVEFGANAHSKAFFESAIAAAWQKTAQGIFDTGNWVQQAREELDRAVYDALNLPFGPRTRQRLIAIATHSILATHVSQLPPSWGTLYELTRVPGNILLAKLRDGTIKPDLERRDIRSKILGQPPRSSKVNGQAEAPLDPLTVWKALSPADKTAILDSEGRAGLAKLLSPDLIDDLVNHLIQQQMFGASTKAKPAVTLTAILRAALDPSSIVDSLAVLKLFKAKLLSFGLDLHAISIAINKEKGQGRGKRARR
jgi:hypothetical protein